MEDNFYSIDDLIAITGLSKDHLTDSDGPIARICRAFPDPALGDRRQGLNYEGLQYLTGYLEALEDGMGYEDWVKQASKPAESTGGLVVVPTVQAGLIAADEGVDLAVAQLARLKRQITVSSEQFGDYYESAGLQLGLELAERFGKGINAGIEKGVTSTYEKLKLT